MTTDSEIGADRAAGASTMTPSIEIRSQRQVTYHGRTPLEETRAGVRQRFCKQKPTTTGLAWLANSTSLQWLAHVGDSKLGPALRPGCSRPPGSVVMSS